jgi:hypothetical protein
MHRKITRFARGSKWGGRAESSELLDWLPACDDANPVNAKYPNPADSAFSASRREKAEQRLKQ